MGRQYRYRYQKRAHRRAIVRGILAGIVAIAGAALTLLFIDFAIQLFDGIPLNDWRDKVAVGFIGFVCLVPLVAGVLVAQDIGDG